MEFIHNNLAQIISSLGLLLDMIGVFFVFKFGVPNKIDGSKIPFHHKDNTVTKIGPNHGKKAYLGVPFLLIGLFLQIISNWL